MSENYTLPERVIQTKDSKVLGRNIKKLRKEFGLKQIDVITKLQLKGVCISTSAYSKLEQGMMNPKVTLLISLVDILECDFNALFKI